MPDDRNFILPATLRVLFPRSDSGVLSLSEFWPVDIAIASLGIDEVDGAFGYEVRTVQGSQVAVFTGGGTPDNEADLDAFALQLAKDWYRWQLGLLDIKLDGIREWITEGFHDIEWHYRPNDAATRIFRAPFREWIPLCCDTGGGGGGGSSFTLTIKEVDGSPSLTWTTSGTLSINQEDFLTLTGSSDSGTISGTVCVVEAYTESLPSYSRSGNTLTASANGAFPTLDGVTLSLTESFLHNRSYDESNLSAPGHADNGPFTLTDLGSGGSKWEAVRHKLMFSRAFDGFDVIVKEGTNHSDTTWRLTTSDPITLNTDDITFHKVAHTLGYENTQRAYTDYAGTAGVASPVAKQTAANVYLAANDAAEVGTRHLAAVHSFATTPILDSTIASDIFVVDGADDPAGFYVVTTGSGNLKYFRNAQRIGERVIIFNDSGNDITIVDQAAASGGLSTFKTDTGGNMVWSDGYRLYLEATSEGDGLWRAWTNFPGTNLVVSINGETGLIILDPGYRIDITNVGPVFTFDWVSPLIAKGDIFTFTTTDARLPVVYENQILTSNSGETTGLKWFCPTAGAGRLIISNTNSADGWKENFHDPASITDTGQGSFPWWDSDDVHGGNNDYAYSEAPGTGTGDTPAKSGPIVVWTGTNYYTSSINDIMNARFGTLTGMVIWRSATQWEALNPPGADGVLSIAADGTVFWAT